MHFITIFPAVSSEQKTAWRIPIISLCLYGCIILNSACNIACAQHSMIIIPDDILAQYSAALKRQAIDFSRYSEGKLVGLSHCAPRHYGVSNDVALQSGDRVDGSDWVVEPVAGGV